MNTLSYCWKIRQGKVEKERIVQHERKYIDFIVSGKSLSDIFNTKKLDMITTLGWSSNTDYTFKTIREFLKQETPELETGRTIIYGCPECVDIGCGAITAEIIDNGNTIVWKNFAFENDYEGFSLDDYKHIGQFEFDKHQYFTAFEKIKSQIEQTQLQ